MGLRHPGFGLLVVAGCYPGPELPLIDDVPVEAATSCAPARQERVSCVLDGDTFDVHACGQDVGERVRMLGIDAPEIAHGDEPADCYGDEAAAELRRLLSGHTVQLTFDAHCEDMFDRTLAYAWISFDELDGAVDPSEVIAPQGALLVNEWMLLQGFAPRYEEDFGTPLRLVERFKAAEAQAKSRGLGLWSACQ